MKPRLIFIGLLVVSILLVSCSGNSNAEGATNSEIQADWPMLSLDEMTQKADLIAFVSVKSTAEEDRSNGIVAQISTLKVLETLSGQTSGKVKLNQATNYLEKGGNYLLFLSKNGTEEYYFVMSPAGVIKEHNGVYVSNVFGGNGKFNQDQIKNLLLD
ncbi:hypothetical protein [Virgibacillus sp. DJP39]|uniref:hypothetical protein n=1 Tax=Virgibacillus sp. DJP39 TaxID=3409790 RepID=UPI003BB50EE3